MRGNDAAFADTLDQIAAKGEELKIRNDMVVAAERLDENKPADATPLEERALANLKSLQATLDKHQARRRTRKSARSCSRPSPQAKENLGKIKELHTKMLDAMEEIRGATDKNTEMFDAMEEAYEELLENTKESLLEIPTDLHVFTDLNVANDIVEDVFSVFQEVEQAGDSTKKAAAAEEDRRTGLRQGGRHARDDGGGRGPPRRHGDVARRNGGRRARSPPRPSTARKCPSPASPPARSPPRSRT